MRKIVVAGLLVAALSTQASAQFGCAGPNCPHTIIGAAPIGGTAPAPVPTPTPPVQPPAPVVTTLPVIVAPAPVAAPAPAPTSFSIGSLGAELLGWIAAVFGAPIGVFLTKWVMAVAKRAGVEVSASMSDKLDLIIQNGIMAGAHKIGADMKGRLNVDVRNQLVAQAIEYAKAHGADTIKDLANSKSSLAWLKDFDPNSAQVREALQARAAKVLNDVSAPDALAKPPATTADAPIPPPAGPAAATQDPPPVPAPAAPAVALAPPASGANPAPVAQV